jgi:hypothetical protein
MRIAAAASALLVLCGFAAGYALLNSKSAPPKVPIAQVSAPEPTTANLFSSANSKPDEIARMLAPLSPQGVAPVAPKPKLPAPKVAEKSDKPRTATRPVLPDGPKSPTSVFLDVPVQPRSAKRL